jgi:Luciferase
MSRLIDKISAQVGNWEGIVSARHRFGGTEFLLEGREIGHVHNFGLVDIGYSRAIRDYLVSENLAEPHHIYPDSALTSFYVNAEKDVEHALWLFRLSFLRHFILLSRRPERHKNLPRIDVDSELARLKLAPDFRRLFDEMLRGLNRDSEEADSYAM